jgi:hypothetical protein
MAFFLSCSAEVEVDTETVVTIEKIVWQRMRRKEQPQAVSERKKMKSWGSALFERQAMAADQCDIFGVHAAVDGGSAEAV